MKLLIALTFAALAISGCTDVPKAEHALQVAGYSDIHITGYRWTGCSDKDTFSTGFTAKGPTGISTTGVVCSGLFKGATIRLD